MLGMLFAGWLTGPAGHKLLLPLLNEKDSSKIVKPHVGIAESMKLYMKKPAIDKENIISVIPKPVVMKRSGGSFNLKYTTTIYYDQDLPQIRDIANYLAECLRPATGMSFAVQPLLVESANKQPADSIESRFCLDISG